MSCYLGVFKYVLLLLSAYRTLSVASNVCLYFVYIFKYIFRNKEHLYLPNDNIGYDAQTHLFSLIPQTNSF